MVDSNKHPKECKGFRERKQLFPPMRLVEDLLTKYHLFWVLNIQIKFAYCLRSDSLKAKLEMGILMQEIH